MKLTAEERREAYEYALNTVEKYPNNSFMCNSLERWLSIQLDIINVDVLDYFEEFSLFRPKDKWFVWLGLKDEDNNVRKTILEFCIEMTKK
jgi:hypothetical protein